MKRKRQLHISDVQLPSGSSPVPDLIDDTELLLLQLNEQIEQVRDATHVDIVRKKEKLGLDMDRKITAADRHRKLQIKNINELYDFEIEEAKTRYERSLNEIQEGYLQDLEAEAKRLKAARDATSSTNDEATADGSDSPKGASGFEVRATRSSISVRDHTMSSFKESRSSARGRRTQQTSKENLFHELLSEEDMRSDFVTIVKDIEKKAVAYAGSVPPKPSIACMVDDLERLTVGSVRYTQGDMVHVYSTASGETFSGAITSISSTEFIVRCGSGTRISVLLGLLRSGRVVVSLDVESTEAASMVNKAGALLLEQRAHAAHAVQAAIPKLSMVQKQQRVGKAGKKKESKSPLIKGKEVTPSKNIPRKTKQGILA